MATTYTIAGMSWSIGAQSLANSPASWGETNDPGTPLQPANTWYRLGGKGRQACAASVRTLPNEQATLDLGQFFMPRGASLVDPARCLACCGGRPSTTSTRTQRVSRRSLPTRSTPSATTASPSRGGPSRSLYCYEGVAPSPKLLHAIVAWPGSSSPRADVVDANVTVSSRAWAPIVIGPVACQLAQPQPFRRWGERLGAPSPAAVDSRTAQDQRKESPVSTSREEQARSQEAPLPPHVAAQARLDAEDQRKKDQEPRAYVVGDVMSAVRLASHARTGHYQRQRGRRMAWLKEQTQAFSRDPKKPPWVLRPHTAVRGSS